MNYSFDWFLGRNMSDNTVRPSSGNEGYADIQHLIILEFLRDVQSF